MGKTIAFFAIMTFPANIAKLDTMSIIMGVVQYAHPTANNVIQLQIAIYAIMDILY